MMSTRFVRIECRSKVVRVLGAMCAVVALTSAACQNQDTAPPADDIALAAACDSVTQTFMTTLKGELVAAMTEGGPPHAVEVCKIMAPDIASRFSRLPGVTVKRVSARNRNPANAPDDFEAAALMRLAAAGEPGFFYQWRTDSDGDSTFVYFKAIRTTEVCLACHGPRETLGADLLAVLEREYPDDLATGYAAGDLRGAFVVAVDKSAAGAFAGAADNPRSP